VHSYASSAEIRSYIKAVAFHYGVDKYITFNALVNKAVWHEEDSKWTVSVQGQGDIDCEILINASGILNHVKLPVIKGLDTFRGPVLHTAAWDESTHLRGKRVAIIGAGASAIQTLPAIQNDVAHVDVHIRTPSWIMPPILESMATAKNLQYTSEEQAKFRDDAEYSVRVRKEMESASNKVLKAYVRGSSEQAELRAKLEENMKILIADEELQKHLIPQFDVGCRRLSPGEPYIKALQQPNVTPIFGEINEVTSGGIVSGMGHRSVDVIIAATGFDTSFRPRFPIIGKGGVDLRELWKDEPVSYCGLAVSGFPNYLIFLGPNNPISNGSVMGSLEATADYFIRIFNKMIKEDALSFNVRLEAQADFDHHTQKTMENMVWSGKCNSWYKNKKGKVVALWPGSSLHYREVLESNRWEDYEWQYRGNRFAYWGHGFAGVEHEADGDLAFYIKPRAPLPLEAYYLSAKGSTGRRSIGEPFQSCTANGLAG
jgi:cation diffusion facilitator CzcD-associated flavoprotein CzcO